MARPRGKLCCIMGPTAAGKTAAAFALAERLPVALISVDSAQVYRHMDIGSGKPTPAELAAHPHALIDIRDPAITYSAADFAVDAARAVRDAWSRDRLPVLVGGTGLYFRALLTGLTALPRAAPGLRAEIEARAARSGWPALHGELRELDPVTAERLHPNDAQRIQRALEVCVLSAAPMSALLDEVRPAIDAEVLELVVAPAVRSDLHSRIARRFDAMLAHGLIGEVSTLRARPGLTRQMASMRSVGYRQTWDYLAGDISRAALPERGKAATRQLARRQLTWLRGRRGPRWFDSGDGSWRAPLIAAVERFVASGV